MKFDSIKVLNTYKLINFKQKIKFLCVKWSCSWYLLSTTLIYDLGCSFTTRGRNRLYTLDMKPSAPEKQSEYCS